MRRIRMRLLISSVGLLLLLLPGVALAGQPGIPEAFHGRTTGAPGAVISAVIGGSIAASTTIGSNGTYGYAPHLFLVPDPEGNRGGAAISFLIGTTSAMETALFAGGAITALDLVLPGTVLDEPTTTATTTASSTPEAGDDTSDTTMTIATSTSATSTTASAGSSGGGASGGRDSSPTSSGVSSGASPHAVAGSSPAARAPGRLPKSSGAITQPALPFEDIPSPRLEEGGRGLALVSGTRPDASFPLAAAAALAPNGALEPLLLLLAYAGAGTFFLYALLYRYRLRLEARG